MSVITFLLYTARSLSVSDMEFNNTNFSKPRKQISPTNTYSLNGKIMLCSVVVLFVAVLAIICFHGYARWFFKRRRRAQNHLISLHHDDVSSLDNASQGLDLSVLKRLPTFVYMSVTDHDVDSFLECAVCLSEFEHGEEGRVLPKCKHVFHIQCIDMWFHSHSNCPLCRAPIQASDETEIKVERTRSVIEPVDLRPVRRRTEEDQMGCSSSKLSEMVLPLGQQRRPLELVGVVVEEPSSSSCGEERVIGSVGMGLGSLANQRPKPPVTAIFGLKRIWSV